MWRIQTSPGVVAHRWEGSALIYTPVALLPPPGDDKHYGNEREVEATGDTIGDGGQEPPSPPSAEVADAFTKSSTSPMGQTTVNEQHQASERC